MVPGTGTRMPQKESAGAAVETVKSMSRCEQVVKGGLRFLIRAFHEERDSGIISGQAMPDCFCAG